jgi:hypothetical protein
VQGDTITLFMWGWQRHFRRLLEWNLQQALKALGVTVEPTVFLIGILETGNRSPLCVEPEDGPIVPADFDGLHDRATELYQQDPNSRIHFSDERSQQRKHREFLDRAYGTAISEVLEAKLGPGRRFFVSLPTLVEQHRVFTAIGLPEWVLDDTPHLTSETVADRHRVTRSLIQGAIDEVLRLSSQALYEPDPGSNLDIGINRADVAKAAGEALISSATMLAGGMPSRLFDALNLLATTQYERRVGIGSLLLADAESEHVHRSVILRKPVYIGETRTLRKLLETSSKDGESLLTDGEEVYGLGHQRDSYPAASESVFQVLVVKNGVWELRHAGVSLATVRFGAPRLPEEELERKQFDDICGELFRECDADALWALAESAKGAKHGTMLVISDQAAEEADRLASQALTIEPRRLDGLVGQVTSIDGAVLVDPSAYCHAIGVILDGTVTIEGDRSRGARYNSALKYLAFVEGKAATVILVVSEDGMINLFPDRRGRGDTRNREAT